MTERKSQLTSSSEQDGVAAKKVTVDTASYDDRFGSPSSPTLGDRVQAATRASHHAFTL